MKRIMMITCMVSCLFLGACNHSNEDTSPVGILTRFKDKLQAFCGKATKKTYKIEQIDNYYGIDIESSEDGMMQRYVDDFSVNTFTQTIGDSVVTGKKETGISKDNNLYQISYYGTDDPQNSVAYYVNNSENYQYLFQFDFASEYIRNIIDLTIAYYQQEDTKLSLNTNFDMVKLNRDGQYTLQYRFISYANNGTTKLEEVQRDDVITIEKGNIVKVKTVMLYQLQDGINYNYMETDAAFYYDEMTAYTEERLNPDDFKTAAAG